MRLSQAFHTDAETLVENVTKPNLGEEVGGRMDVGRWEVRVNQPGLNSS